LLTERSWWKPAAVGGAAAEYVACFASFAFISSLLTLLLFILLWGLDLRMMFDPITPLEFKPPAEKRPGVPLAGVASLLTNFENTAPPERKPFIPPVEAKKIAQERLQKLHQEKNELLVQDWDPHNNPKATGNAFATVFVSRLSYDTNEKKLRRDFELYGPIRSIRVVHDTEGKSRGYAFIEYETEKDAEAAVRKSEGKRIEGRRIVCDVERGRYVFSSPCCCCLFVCLMV
jgi:U1 small nuclear ribonucleoprotein